MNAINTQEIVIAHPVSNEQIQTIKAFFKALKIKFEVAEKPYNPKFVAKILESEKQIAQGKTKKVKKEDLKHYLGL